MILGPSKYRIEDMIDLYPALKLQYDRFVEVYRLCVDDYKSQKEDKDEASLTFLRIGNVLLQIEQV